MPTALTAPLTELRELYEDLHAHPELSFCETRTAAVIADRLEGLGYDVTRGVGRTGVVAVLENGEGPTVLCRADMDALPLVEETGLAYASAERAIDANGVEVGVTHACGHDMHVTWLLGAAHELLARRAQWNGRAMLVFQPAEEIGAGSQAMVDDGLFERFGTPDVALGQHTAPAPIGLILQRSGPAMAASDSVKVILHGRGGHGSSPQNTVDPAVLAAAVVLRLQTIVSREIDPSQTAVVTVGSVQVGSRSNVIADDAVLRLSIRTFSDSVRKQIIAAVERIVKGECAAAGCTQDPEIIYEEHLPLLRNDEEAIGRVASSLSAHFGTEMIVESPVIAGSEDFGNFATAAGCPAAFWFVGVTDPDQVSKALSEGRYNEDIPSIHSPRYTPVPEPTIRIGTEAMTEAALAWLTSPHD